MNEIRRAITPDGMVGFDQYDQLIHTERRGQELHIRPITDVRDETCVICNRGWELTGPAFGDQAHWSLTGSWVHDTCLIRHGGLCERREFQNAMINARAVDVPVRWEKTKLLPNGYWGARDRGMGARPWYRFDLMDHPVRFIIGNRKRVTHVEVIPNGGHLTFWETAELAFEGEDVTKHFGPTSVLVHAWTAEKLRMYVAKLAWLAAGSPEGGPA